MQTLSPRHGGSCATCTQGEHGRLAIVDLVAIELRGAQPRRRVGRAPEREGRNPQQAREVQQRGIDADQFVAFRQPAHGFPQRRLARQVAWPPPGTRARRRSARSSSEAWSPRPPSRSDFDAPRRILAARSAASIPPPIPAGAACAPVPVREQQGASAMRSTAGSGDARRHSQSAARKVGDAHSHIGRSSCRTAPRSGRRSSRCRSKYCRTAGAWPASAARRKCRYRSPRG